VTASNARDKDRGRASQILQSVKFIAESGGTVLIDLPTVRGLAGNLSTASIYRLANFPKPVRVSAGRRAWVLAEVQDWIAARIADRDQPRGEKRP
jgi:predicted DNA-binding transcriptional regulator AlpA